MSIESTTVEIPEIEIPSVEGGTGLVGAADFTFMEIIAENPNHYWRMNTGSGGVPLAINAGAGDNGWGSGGSSNVAGEGSPGYAAETPMTLEPLTTSISFEGTDDRLFGTRDRWLSGTILFFFATRNAANLRWLYGQCNSGGITNVALRLRGDVNDQTLDLFISVNGVVNFYTSTFDLGSALPLHPNYNMVAVRQPADGSGIDWFFNGSFFDATDSEVTEATGGTLAANVDPWLQATADSGNAATRNGIGARPITSPDQFFDGLIFSMVNDNRVWSDAAINNLWLLALANGL